MTPNVGRTLLATLWRQPVVVVAAILSTVFTTLFDATIPLLAGSAVDAATGSAGHSVSAVVWILVAVALSRYVFQFGRRYFAGVLSNAVQHGLRIDVLRSLQLLDGPRQDQLITGQVVSRSISDLNLVQAMVAMFPILLGHFLKIAITLIILAWINPWLMLIAVVSIPPLVWLSLRSRSTLFAATWSAQQSVANLATHIEETVTGVRVVKAFAQEDREVATLDALSRRVYSEQMRSARLTARFKPLVQQLPNIALVLGIGLGGFLALRGHITIGSFLAFSAYLTSMTAVVSMLAGMVIQVQLGLSSFDRVMDVINLKPEVAEPDHPVAVPEGPLGIECESISFDGILKDFSLSVAAGETVSLVGPPGSGKTMLVQLLTGFYRPAVGSLRVGGVDYSSISRSDLRAAIGCVFDEPFLYSATIRENIDMGRGLSDADIFQAIRWSQAEDFISALPQGIDQVVGERGLTLSGGQRQRIAIARALATRPRVLILDDATSAIDASTERAVFQAIRTELPDTTIITVAHRHSTLSFSDRIALVEDGRVTRVGDGKDMREDPQFAHLMDLSPPTDESGEEGSVPFDSGAEPHWDSLWPVPAAETDARLTMSSSAIRAAASSAGAKPGGRGGRSAAASMPATPELLARVDALPRASESPGPPPTEELSEVSAHHLFGSVRTLILLVIGLYVVGVAAGLAIPTLVRRAIDDGVTQGNASVLWDIIVIGLTVVVIAWCADRATTILTARTGERLLYHLRVRSYAHLQKLGMDYYETTMSGTIMTRMTTDIDALNSFLQTSLAQTVVSLTTLIGILVLLGFTNVTLFLIALVGVPVVAIATFFFRRISSRLYTRAREEISSVNAMFQEAMNGLKASQMAGMEEYTIARFARRAAAYRRTRVQAQTAVAVYFPGINAVSELLQATVLAVGTQLVVSGQIKAGVLVAFLLYLDRLYTPIQHLSQVFDSYQQAQVGFHRISSLLATQPSVSLGGDQRVAAAGPIEFSDVSFSYSPDTEVIRNFHARFEPGSTVAVVGPTGAGKSTAIKLVERFYDPTRGSVSSSGTDLRELPLAQWRQRVGFVPQEAHLFTGTVADNIAYGRPDASQQEITDAARRVGALTAIAAITGGFHARVGERGRGLSSGQRQLIALARAEMIEPDVLLLDEATATLDPASEATILKASERLTRNRTSIVIAHRLATAAKADQILVVDKGTIVEKGTHEELRTFGGIYSRMWAHGEGELRS
ncbi:ABC transporter domain-containing ATP-binding protein [Corynebacterium ulcerans]|uniref:ABC transporter domain-containing ATP-binding protein n=1 Tax=Corynebacterium ulcerans FRC58 TaxID=1408268 RepID=A0ABN4GYP8_CORUL|nr:ABC transporter ATP-binding protein [Corynebacterium ulcerans]AIU30202.1 ABC transporter domain-containing ATP-binding protein [Corynebacterium ulcerans]AKN76778.1 ABC transporter domain-containing ATP-binding protein [Corynebacterium ulcerans FRC58]NOL61755.1 ABC transporter ATP-binding protein [Corynebacterium ulcerans]NON16990.1 ABC transporter ATP-binding protein [Corynebacterium ulcerans]